MPEEGPKPWHPRRKVLTADGAALGCRLHPREQLHDTACTRKTLQHRTDFPSHYLLTAMRDVAKYDHTVRTKQARWAARQSLREGCFVRTNTSDVMSITTEAAQA